MYHSLLPWQRFIGALLQPLPHRLRLRLPEQNIEVGRVGGHVLLEDTTLSERREIASFVARPPYAGKSLKVKLVDVEKVLQHSFGCSLPDLLVGFFPAQPLETR